MGKREDDHERKTRSAKQTQMNHKPLLAPKPNPMNKHNHSNTPYSVLRERIFGETDSNMITDAIMSHIDEYRESVLQEIDAEFLERAELIVREGECDHWLITKAAWNDIVRPAESERSDDPNIIRRT